MSQWRSTPALNEVAQKWRALAERRRAELSKFHQSGDWKRYYSEADFLERIREANQASERWAEIAPPPPRPSTVRLRRTAA